MPSNILWCVLVQAIERSPVNSVLDKGANRGKKYTGAKYACSTPPPSQPLFDPNYISSCSATKSTCILQTTRETTCCRLRAYVDRYSLSDSNVSPLFPKRTKWILRARATDLRSRRMKEKGSRRARKRCLARASAASRTVGSSMTSMELEVMH